MAEYTNDLRLKEIGTGESSGTWGTETNTNLELIAEAFSYGTEASFGSDADATTTIADGATDPARSLYLKITSGVSLTATRTLTIAPNTVSKIWIIENATSGSQSINISQGSGANVTIPSGDVKVIYTDGAGSGAAVVDAFTDLNTSGTLTATNLAGTLTTAAQPNITSVGTLTGFTSTGIDDNATSTAITIDSSENVGIGTASPAALLDVAGNFIFKSPANTLYGNFDNTTAGYGAFRLQNQGSNYGFIGQTSSILASGGSNTALGLRSENEFAIATGGSTEKMRIDSSGNVGIGTTSPSVLIEGQTSTANSAYLRLGTTLSTSSHVADSDIGALEFYSGDASGAGSGVKGSIRYKYGSTSGATTHMTFHTAGISSGNDTERMRIDSSGNVGIGTADPAYNLSVGTVGTTANSYIQIGTTTTGAGNLFFGDTSGTGAGSYSGYVQYDHNTDSMILGTASTERMRIDSSGLVGIGTSSPETFLHIKTTSPTISMTDTNSFSDTNDRFQIRANADVGQFQWYDDSASSTTTLMTLTPSGNVGIGATTIDDKLHLEGSVDGSVAVKVQNNSTGSSSYAGLNLAGQGNNFTIKNWGDSVSGKSNQTEFVSTAGSSYYVFTNNGSESMRIDSGNNVGIGNTSPSSYSSSADDLVVGTSGDTGITVVSGTASNGQLKFADGTSGDATGRGIIDYNHAADSMAFKTAATERMRITSNGFTKHSNTGVYDTYSGADDSHQFVSDNASHSTLWVTNTNASYATSMLRTESARAASSAFNFLAATSGNLTDDQFLLRGDGNAYADGSWNGGGADYAEYFEWSDGNTGNEDRRGYTVVLSENKIRKSTSEDNPNNIIGVVSGNPSVIGDSDIGAWKNKYQKDDYGSYIKDENGDRVINDEYDETQDYISREDRQEWDIIGLMGKVRINKGQTVGDRWIKMRDISDTVEEWLIK